ncbi:MAG: 2-C-methyl-D-erythritol 4-phosphate cytidylyltransferase [Candidatus Omnitrophica bacterium]|nr:2-C-methyl-D-erythritol 4-phosphate cytidylyltransferase [Candidatus Omnitrophota bacterium]
MKASAVIVAAGSSRRLPAEKRKPFILVGGKPLLAYTLGKFFHSGSIDTIILTVNSKDLKLARALAKKYGYGNRLKIISGGRTRKESVRRGLKEVPNETDYVVVHDGVRPFFNEKSLSKLLKMAAKHGAAILAVPVVPTVKKVGKGLFIESTLDREKLWEAQTPQVFKKELLEKAHKKFCRQKATDDSSLVERLGIKVKVVKGSRKNIKITTPEDLAAVELLIKEKS